MPTKQIPVKQMPVKQPNPNPVKQTPPPVKQNVAPMKQVPVKQAPVKQAPPSNTQVPQRGGPGIFRFLFYIFLHLKVMAMAMHHASLQTEAQTGRRPLPQVKQAQQPELQQAPPVKGSHQAVGNIFLFSFTVS